MCPAMPPRSATTTGRTEVTPCPEHTPAPPGDMTAAPMAVVATRTLTVRPAPPAPTPRTGTTARSSGPFRRSARRLSRRRSVSPRLGRRPPSPVRPSRAPRSRRAGPPPRPRTVPGAARARRGMRPRPSFPRRRVAASPSTGPVRVPRHRPSPPAEVRPGPCRRPVRPRPSGRSQARLSRGCRVPSRPFRHRARPHRCRRPRFPRRRVPPAPVPGPTPSPEHAVRAP